jgi:4-amino-4-deoxy-L-arabinose transferase-like glycosyltransferase
MTTLPQPMTAVKESVAARPRWLRLSLAAAAIVTVLGLPTIVIPFFTDQIWFSLGARTILDGDQLYRDLWDQKTPLIYFLYAVPYGLVGEHPEAIRLLDLLNVLVAMTGVFVLGQRLFGARAGAFAAGLFAFAYLAWTAPSDLAESESFMAAPLVFAFALYLPDDSRRDASLRAILAGLLLGVVAAFKAPAFLFLLCLPATEILLRRNDAWSRTGAARRLALAAAGFAVVPLALVAYMAASGVLHDFIDIQRNYTAHYNAYRYAPAGISHLRFLLDSTSSFISGASFLVVPAIGAVIFAFFRPRGARAVTLLAILTLVGVAIVWWQGKMFSYHWLVLLPLLALLAGYALDQFSLLFAQLSQRKMLSVWALLGLGLVVLAYPTLRDTYDDYVVLVHRVSGSMSAREVEAYYSPLYPQNREIVDYVRANGGPDDRIFVWGLWPQVYFWLDRPPVDRFIVNSGLRATWAPVSWRREVMDDLTSEPPRYFAVACCDVQPWLVGTSQTSDEHLRDSFPELKLFLERNYTPVFDHGLFQLYERVPGRATQ